jgi:hypothetical protein
VQSADDGRVHRHLGLRYDERHLLHALEGTLRSCLRGSPRGKVGGPKSPPRASSPRVTINPVPRWHRLRRLPARLFHLG